MGFTGGDGSNSGKGGGGLGARALRAMRVRALRWSRGSVHAGPARRVLIQFPYRLGDFLLLTPALEALGRDHPQVRVTLWVSETHVDGLQELARGNPWIAEVRTVAGVGEVLAHGRGFDRIVRLGRASGLDDLAALLNPRAQVTGGDRPLLTTAENITEVFFEAVTGRNRKEDESMRPRLYRDTNEAWEAGKGTGGGIVLAVGGDDHNRRYPHWSDLAHALRSESGRPVSALGRAADIEAAGLSEFSSDANSSTALRSVAAELADAAAVVTTDTLFLHLCSALGVGGVALFGPTDPALRIWNHGAGAMTVLRRSGSCDRLPCHNDMYDECRTGRVPCMDFAPDRVVATVLAVLEPGSGSR